MSSVPAFVPLQCLPLRETLSASNMKSMFRGFVYEYETPKIVTIHSISIALMCRLIQLLILIYGIAYLMIHKKGYQVIDTSIISSITLKVKGIGYNQTGQNQTLVIDGADYIVPPQENNALFLMTNFIRTDQEHKRCPESSAEEESVCSNDSQCLSNLNFHKANGKWTGRCVLKNNSTTHTSQSIIRRCPLKNDSSPPIMGLCELEGWCPVEDDCNVPSPIRDALNFTIFIKNFIEFPRFKVRRKNIEASPDYLKSCNYHAVKHRICPIFKVGTILDIVEDDVEEQTQMLKFGGVIRVKIDWKCNLDKPLYQCIPEYTFGRLDARYKDESFSQGFNFRFASHWKHQNRSFRTLTKAFGLRFIISVSGQAGLFDVITLSLNIGSLIGILGLATFICDIVALYVHRQSDVYRQQKFQDVDLNLLRLETLNSLPVSMMSEESKRKHQDHLENAILTGHIIENNDATSAVESPYKEGFRRNKANHHDLHNNVSSTTINHNQASTPMLTSDNYHQQHIGATNSLTESPLTLLKQRRSVATRPSHLISSSNHTNDKPHIDYVDADSPELNDQDRSNETKHNFIIKTNPTYTNGNEQLNRPSPKLETFL